jgi:flavorubredoxin
MNIKTIQVGPLETNCYILSIDNECIVVDPGDEFFKIKKAIGDKKVIGCLVTHFHQDHIEALEELVSYYDVEINKSKYGKFEYEIIETPFPAQYHRDKKLYSSKTKSAGIKIEITTNYYGFIVSHSLPTQASTHDINLHRMTTKDISMKGKYILGDSGYVSKE